MADKHAGPPPGLHLYTRDGFLGKMAVAIRPYEVYEYTSVTGPHAPHQVALDRVACADASDAAALPTVVATSRNGVTLSVSRRTQPTPFLFRNTEADEVHFVQEGTFRYVTDFGTLEAGPGDFVWLGRTITYDVHPTGDAGLRIIVETPEMLDLNPPAPFGMVNFGRDVKRPAVTPPAEDGPRELWLKSFDGITRFTTVHDPVATKVIVDGTPPAWSLNLAAIATLSYAHGGPPAQFLQTPSTDLMFYTLSSRPPEGRPPQHHNADYDELIFYVEGPGAYGAIHEPARLAWVPKGVTHWGPEEHVPEGYLAWLLESRGTMRLTEAGAAAAVLMETGSFGPQAS
ncbi:MAG: homogentisate 1,2-dioxygenase [Actinobacteria bacterium]|jgi:homogentisate 1,2-dioxygenase|nr:homogentisate 1,2-dioxygenase [Actinomycetota bacterium]